jgi:hypothetical protein
VDKPFTKSEIKALVADWPFAQPQATKAKVRTKSEPEPVLSRKDRVLRQTLADFLAGEKQ